MDRNITETNHLKNTLTLLAVMVMVIATLLTACSSGTSQPANAEKETTQVKEETTEVKEVEEVEPTAEPTPEPTEEPKQAASLEEYIAQLDPNEICVVVWNENTNRQEKFTEDQKCIVKDGDIVVVPVDERPIMSVYYGDISQKYDERGYYVVNVEGSEWLALSITYEIGNDEYNTLFLPTKKE